FEGHTGAVLGVAFLPDGRRALSGAADGTVRLWQLPPPQKLAEAGRHFPSSGAFTSRAFPGAGLTSMVTWFDAEKMPNARRRMPPLDVLTCRSRPRKDSTICATTKTRSVTTTPQNQPRFQRPFAIGHLRGMRVNGGPPVVIFAAGRAESKGRL